MPAMIGLDALASHAQPMDFAGEFTRLRHNAAGEADSVRLHRLFDLSWEYAMYEYPEWATWEGYPGRNDRWTDNSMAAIERRQREAQWPLDVLAAINRDALGPEDRLNYDIFRRNAESGVEGFRFPSHLLPISQLGGVQQDVASMMEMMPRRNALDYRDIMARLRGVQRLVRETIALMTEGLARKIVPPAITMRDVPDQVMNVIPADAAAIPLLIAFAQAPATMPAAEFAALRQQAVELYNAELRPAFAELHEFLVKKYLPACRASIGLGDVPGGAEWYAYRVRQTTTTDLSPQQIFDLGMSEVKRIRAEMDTVIKSTGFTGTFAEFTTFLRTDPRFFYTDAASLLAGYRDICKRVDPQLITLFGRLPRLPYGVVPVPSYAEKSQTTAYYNGGSLEAGRPGYFYANTYDLKSRPKWEMEPLALHEAVPGHHLQIALAHEMENVPRFRKSAEYTAYVEGWGLYAESLGSEMGFYADPYSRFGQLTYEMWRAIRLVLDPGIHVKGWTRQQAIAFFTENSSKAAHDIEVEVDRYISWPGQATAYKVGELKLKELRRYAQEKLGDRFDIRAFHDQILGAGALPLDVLEARIHAWVEGRK